MFPRCNILIGLQDVTGHVYQFIDDPSTLPCGQSEEVRDLISQPY